MSDTPSIKTSILTSIPIDATNIIKDFLVETREVEPLKIYSIDENFIEFLITKYKEGYKIDKIVSIDKFNKNYNHLTEEQRVKNLTKIQKKIFKHYPVYIDDKNDLITYMYNIFYSEFCSCEIDDDDDDDIFLVRIKIGGNRSIGCVKSFNRKLNLFIPLIGKVFKKNVK